MRFPRLRTILLVPVVLFALFYAAAAIYLLQADNSVGPFDGQPARYNTVAIFGASGTAGDGILKAALANPEIDRIHVFTRRTTPRIDGGVASGKITMTLHMDYLDYSAIHDQIADVDAVYWGIGTSTVGVDEETYGRIHVDFPARFVEEWLGVSRKTNISFHYISSSDISEDSKMMWAREKVRAENTLFDMADGTKLRVIAYRPDYIGPTKEEAHLGQDLLYWFFAPVGAAVKATQIGQAMFEATARQTEFEHRRRLGTRTIIRFSDAFETREHLLAKSLDSYAPLEHHTFTHDGIEREYFVHVPENSGERMPVVIAIHGYTSTATGFAVFHDLRSHANENGYIVVYPQGTHFVDKGAEGPYRVTSWNMLGGMDPHPDAGPQCLAEADQYPCPPECGACDRCTWASCNDDMGYFTTLLELVETTYQTDTNRYYALGMSNGGMMTVRLGCSLSERFAAVAPIDAQMPMGYGCTPSTSLPIIHLAGGMDDTVRLDGKPSGDGFIYVSGADMASAWAGALQCESGPKAWSTDASDQAGLRCTAHEACAIDGHEIVSCVDPDETHNWPAMRPGGAWPVCVTSQQKDSMPEQRLCEPRTEYGPHLGMDVIWEFFSRYENQSDGPR